QLVHDLDLSVYGPTGLRYTMWRSGEVDALNNNERVIITGYEIFAESMEAATGEPWGTSPSSTTTDDDSSMTSDNATASSGSASAGFVSSSG
ncbi:unnamed protein product, partial [Hapterophycus canaliculatus]